MNDIPTASSSRLGVSDSRFCLLFAGEKDASSGSYVPTGSATSGSTHPRIGSHATSGSPGTSPNGSSTTHGRRAEAAALTLASYNTATRSIRLVGKGNKERTVPVSQAALPWLEAWLRLRGRKQGPLFYPLRKSGRIDHRHLSSQTIADLLERRRLQAGAPLPVKPHDLRRTLIGDLLDGGTDLATAQAIAGHADPRTTSRYDRRALDMKRDAVDGLRLPRPGAPP